MLDGSITLTSEVGEYSCMSTSHWIKLVLVFVQNNTVLLTVEAQEIHESIPRNPRVPLLAINPRVMIFTSWVYKPAGVPLLTNRVLTSQEYTYVKEAWSLLASLHNYASMAVGRRAPAIYGCRKESTHNL